MSFKDNLLEAAIAGREAPAINAVAKTEGVRPDFLLRQVATGRVVIMQRDGKPPLGIGEGLRTKVNANIGTSTDVFDPDKGQRAECDVISDTPYPQPPLFTLH